ncbi:nicotinate-nucleotide adenylyltransferase [Streptomyces sp. WI03-4A]|uniref:nicotinate-nucleotide adenylyltransferase n=1 Tax=Streptomyces TaxID=1883 RepID=UPI0029B5D05D|nr:nicotinate-nucleotide adenylyltransferase [Streptomyces sp. WI03-4A]MDX2596105.1 nicotinate-nucleotide adenylyltransferase [Streptomyces sp. WI03-4A]
MGEQDMPTGPAHERAARAAGTAVGAAGNADPGAGTVKTPAYGPGNGPAHTGKRRLGVMGGTFDPIHHGHLVAASEVAARFQLDEVVFVPTGQPWQKSHRSVSPAEDRYLMTVIATAENPQFSVSRIDIDRGGPTYTVDTLRDLRALNPDTDLFFITGADALAQLLTWRDSEELFSLAHFIGVTRPGHQLTNPGLPEGGVSLVEVPALAISSTDCRARVAKGDPIWYMVPDGVVRYIDKRELYRGE